MFTLFAFCFYIVAKLFSLGRNVSNEQTMNEYTKSLWNQEVQIETDYHNISYPVPLDILKGDSNKRYTNRSVFNLETKQLMKSLRLMPASKESVIIVTGASANHFYSSVNLLLSAACVMQNASLLYIDYGITPRNKEELSLIYTSIAAYDQKRKNHRNLYYRRFNFNNFPNWIRISNHQDKGGYAWKTIAYMDVYKEWDGITIWVDGGCVFDKYPTNEMRIVKRDGIYSPSSSGTIQKWVHSISMNYWLQHQYITSLDRSKRMLTGGYIFLKKRTVITTGFIDPLWRCSFLKICISPYGTHRGNHRQDQAIVTALIYNMNVTYVRNNDMKHHILFHQDNEREQNKWKELLSEEYLA